RLSGAGTDDAPKPAALRNLPADRATEARDYVIGAQTCDLLRRRDREIAAERTLGDLRMVGWRGGRKVGRASAHWSQQGRVVAGSHRRCVAYRRCWSPWYPCLAAADLSSRKEYSIEFCGIGAAGHSAAARSVTVDARSA